MLQVSRETQKCPPPPGDIQQFPETFMVVTMGIQC